MGAGGLERGALGLGLGRDLVGTAAVETSEHGLLVGPAGLVLLRLVPERLF